jgi:hypothetical protein
MKLIKIYKIASLDGLTDEDNFLIKLSRQKIKAKIY